MKQTMPLDTFAREVERQRGAMADYLIPEPQILVHPTGQILLPNGEDALTFGTRDVFEGQFARELGYPAAFFQSTKQAFPEQWADLVNAMLEHRPKDRIRMVRTLDGNARAYLSNAYARIDNWQIAEAILRIARKHGDWQIVGHEITEHRMYIKIMTSWATDIVPGKKVRCGFIITNSELGDGSLSVRVLIEMEWCTNGAVRELAAKASKIRHSGSAVLPAFTNGAYQMSDGTRRIGEQYLMAQVDDMINHTIDPRAFNTFVDNFRRGVVDVIPIDAPLKDVVDVTAREYGILESETTSILHYLASGGEYNQFGLTRAGIVDAVTLAAQHVERYDDSIRLEEAGGKIIDMAPAKWESIIRTAKAQKPGKN